MTPYASLDASYSFKCNTHRGAFLCLKDYATHEWIEDNKQFRDYMLSHHQNWRNFVKNLGIADCSADRIVLVRGTMKTSSWIVGAFTGQTNRVHDFSAGAQAVPFGKARVQLTTAQSDAQTLEQRSGPRARLPSTNLSASLHTSSSADADDTDDQSSSNPSQVGVKNQCIFLSYYKIRHRFLSRKIEANADPPSLDKDTDDHESSAVPAGGVDSNIELETEHIPVRSCILIANKFALTALLLA